MGMGLLCAALAAAPLAISGASVAGVSRQVQELAGDVERELVADSQAYQEAVDLGIARIFSEADTGLSPKEERRAVATIVREARRAGLDPMLVLGVISVESSFRGRVVSPAGAVGLMQVMPGTGAWYAERAGLPPTDRRQLFDPVRNVQIGVRYLADLIHRFGAVDRALVAYNAGPGRAREVLQGPLAARYLGSYPRRVLSTTRRLHAQLASR